MAEFDPVSYSKANKVAAQMAELSNKVDGNTSQLAEMANEKADKTYVDSVISAVSASPAGVFATLADLQSDVEANTESGRGRIYIVAEDGKWYYWDGSAWTAGGIYQSTGLADRSVYLRNLSEELLNAVYDVYVPVYELGTIRSTTGKNDVSTPGYGRIRTKSYLPNGNYILKFLNSVGSFYTILKYAKDGTYLEATGFNTVQTRYLSDEYLYRIVLSYDDSRVVTDDDIPILSPEIQLFIPKAESCKKKAIEMDYSNELVFKFSPDMGGSYLSDHTFVKGELWVFPVSDDEHSTFVKASRYAIDFEGKTVSLLGQFQHNFGHCNSIDYCEETDTLIFGNGSGNYEQAGVIYIVPNAYSLKDMTQANINNVAIAIDCSEYNFGAKFNVVWGESNSGRYDICYLITDDNSQIRKLQLGKGNNNLGLGQFITGKADDEFNGSFKVLQLYTQDSQGLVNCIQGADYDRGYLYSGIGHDGLWIWKQKLCADGTVIREAQHEQFYDETGNIISNATEGIAINGDYIVIGVTPDIFVLKR